MYQPTVHNLRSRTVITIAILLLLHAFVSVIMPPILLAASKAAGGQLVNSDEAYVLAMWQSAALSLYRVLPIVVISILIAIWWKPLRYIVEKAFKYVVSSLALAVLFGGVWAGESKAYYSVYDYAEVVYIKPNQTCFWVPDAGANKDSQIKFMSQEYLAAQKIAAKSFKIEHTTLQGSGTTAMTNKVIPAGRLLCVERTPWARRWTSSESTGTSHGNESFSCQSKEGITAGIDLSLSATITEDTAHTYLYWFSTKPPVGDPNSPEVTFTSVLYARDLSDVMDGYVSHSIFPIVCQEFSSRTVDQINAESSQMLASVQAKASKLLADKGIVQISIGWGNIDYEKSVQQSIDNAFLAEKVKPYISVLSAQADIELRRALADTLRGRGIPMPSNLVVVPDSFVNSVLNVLKDNKAD